MQKKLRILFVTDSINTEDSSGAKANVAMIESMSQAGSHVKVLHYTRRDISLQDISCVAVSERKMTLNYLLGKSLLVFQRITKLPIVQFFEKRIGFSFLFLNDSQSLKQALEKENPEHYDRVITLSKGASFRPHHAILNSTKWHHQWLAYIHDPYPFHRYPEPYNWFMPGYKQKERFFVDIAKKAQWLGYPSQLLAAWMGQCNPLFLEKAVILPHQMPAKETDNSPLPDFFEKDKFTVLHAGNLLKQRDPFPLIEAWALFLNKHPEAVSRSQLLLIGPASYHEPNLSVLCQTIPSVYRSDGYVAYKTVRQLEAAASVNLIIEAKADSSPFLPAKFPGLVQANRPIFHLGPKHSESRRLLGDTYNYAAEVHDVRAIADSLESCLLKWKENPDVFNLNREDLVKYFSASHLKEKIKYICEKST